MDENNSTLPVSTNPSCPLWRWWSQFIKRDHQLPERGLCEEVSWPFWASFLLFCTRTLKRAGCQYEVWGCLNGSWKLTILRNASLDHSTEYVTLGAGNIWAPHSAASPLSFGRIINRLKCLPAVEEKTWALSSPVKPMPLKFRQRCPSQVCAIST